MTTGTHVIRYTVLDCVRKILHTGYVIHTWLGLPTAHTSTCASSSCVTFGSWQTAFICISATLRTHETTATLTYQRFKSDQFWSMDPLIKNDPQYMGISGSDHFENLNLATVFAESKIRQVNSIFNQKVFRVCRPTPRLKNLPHTSTHL